MATPGQHPTRSPCPAEMTQDRRGFLGNTVALLLGGIALLVPAAAGLAALLSPLRRKAQAGGLLRLTALEVLPEDGTPRRFPVIADRTDAWNYYSAEPIGAVFLRRTGDPNCPVEALHTVCPHAGCQIEYRDTPEGGKFFCPCHGASFDLAGRRLESPSDSPRDMDTLEVARDGLLRGEVWVRYQEFHTGTAEKLAKG
jgi:menaquinol-cytochrome c reductase iron-sulfur subunit